MAEYYITNRHGDEMYARNHRGDQMYIGTSHLHKKYAKKRTGLFYYAKDASLNEFYAWDQNEQIFIQNSGTDTYAKMASGREIYPITREGKSILAKNSDGTTFFAKDEFNHEIPPVNEYGIEEAPFYPLDENNIPRYLRDQNGNSIYPKDQFNNEYYFLRHPVDGKVIFGTLKNGQMKYAVDSSGNEFYPTTGEIAVLRKRNIPLYAKNSLGQIIYKTDPSGNEFYFNRMLPEFADRYAKLKDKTEIYPIHSTKFYEYTILDRYAKNADGSFYYPVDSCGNEYIIDKQLLNHYPITNDRIIIIPDSGNGEPFLVESMNVEKEDIVGLLFRPCMGFYKDFITNRISLHRNSRVKPRTYRIFKFNISSNISIFFTFILCLFLLIFVSILDR